MLNSASHLATSASGIRFGRIFRPSAKSEASPPREYSVAFLVALVSVAALIPAIILALIALDRWSAAEQMRERETAVRLAQTYAQSIDRHLHVLLNTATILAGSRHLRTGDVDVFAELARDAAATADGHFILIDADMQPLVNTRDGPESEIRKTAVPADVRRVGPRARRASSTPSISKAMNRFQGMRSLRSPNG